MSLSNLNMLAVIAKVKRGLGQVVNVPAFYSTNLSSSPAKVYSCFWKIFEKNQNKPNEAGDGPFKKATFHKFHLVFRSPAPALGSMYVALN